ncbi:MAG: CRTAC1 family protein [Candidatus Polarisedimenticolia bacterium]
MIRRAWAPAALCLASFLDASAAIEFVDRTVESGITLRTTNGHPDRSYIIDTLGSGVALLDYDTDGDMDLYFANGSSLEIPAGSEPPGALYRNEGQGRFTDVTRQAGLDLPTWGFGATAGDFDNDGDPDLLVTAWGPDRLFRNEGDGTFRDVAAQAGVADPRWGTGAAFFDQDGDGLLDLYVANYVTFDAAKIPARGDPNSPCTFRGLTVMCGPHGLPGAVNALYRNNGDGTFTDISAQAGLFMEGTYYGLGVVTADIDGDGRQEILVANDSTPNHLYRNLGGGRFQDDAVMAGFAYANDGREQAGMGIAASDLDGDLDLDVLVTNFSHDYTNLRLNDGTGFLEDVSVRLGLAGATLAFLSWGTCMADLENDGDPDIVIANGHVYPEVDKADIGTTYAQRNQVFENMGDLVLRERTTRDAARDPLGHLGVHRGLGAGDLDDDGDIDLVVTVLNGRPILLMNESTPEGGGRSSWVKLRLAGRSSNRDGTGARVTLKAGGRTWMVEKTGGGSYLSSGDPRLHIGLGPAQIIDSLEIRWPSGARQTLSRVSVNQTMVIEEPDPQASARAPQQP